MTCSLYFRSLTISLVLLPALVKVVWGSGVLKVTLDTYEEKTKDTSTKCIKLCVRSSTSGKLRCNLNTTTGHSTAKFPNSRTVSHPEPYEYQYPFSSWEDNIELSATVWNLPAGKTCDTSSPDNKTIHGTGTRLIPRSNGTRQVKLEDINNKWILETATHIKCTTTGCLPPCVAHDDNTGHYICNKDNNKICLPNWHGSKCLKKCVAQNNLLARYNCSSSGEKLCFPGWLGKDCGCWENATNYVCINDEYKVCLPHFYGEMCKFCNNSKKSYKCNEQGEKVCSHNWYGKNCTKFCNNSETSYKCNGQGEKVCSHNWYGKNCTKFCNNSETSYKCNGQGEKVCSHNWYGKNCTKFCNNSETSYKCNGQGVKICSHNWYGKNCTKFFDNGETSYKCNEQGEKICSHNWYGKNCTKFCNNNETSYKCNEQGEKICSHNWYGKNCTKFCNNSEMSYKCNEQGEKVCSHNWYGKNCTKFCDTSETAYKCDTDGTRKCSEYRYGDKCELYCRKMKIISDLYVCEVSQRSEASCPKQWKNRTCSSSCIKGGGEELEHFLIRCNAGVENVTLCSEFTQDAKECGTISPKALKRNSDGEVSSSKLLGGFFGSLFAIIIITTVIVVYISTKKKKSTSPAGESAQVAFVRDFNKAEVILNFDELMRNRRFSEEEDWGRDNPGMMVENPLYDATRKHLRAEKPY